MFKKTILGLATLVLLVGAGLVSADIPANWNYDIDGDGVITEDDYTMLSNYVSSYGYVTPADTGIWEPSFDVNYNGAIYSQDLIVWSNFWYGYRWQNPWNRFDVNNDHQVTTADAWAVANRINAVGEGFFSQDNAYDAPFYDVDGDNKLTEEDFDAVVDYLN